MRLAVGKLLCVLAILFNRFAYQITFKRCEYWEYLLESARSSNWQKPCKYNLLLHSALGLKDFSRIHALCCALIEEAVVVRMVPKYIMRALETLIWLGETEAYEKLILCYPNLPSDEHKKRLERLAGWWLKKDLEKVHDISPGNIPEDAYLPFLDHFAKAYVYDYDSLDYRIARSHYLLALDSLPDYSEEHEIASKRVIELDGLDEIVAEIVSAPIAPIM